MGKKRNGLSFYKKERKIGKKVAKNIGVYAIWTVIMLLLAFTLIYCFGIRTRVIGESMEPTLYNSQEVLVNRFVYFFAKPSRGDVIVFKPNGNDNSHYYIKRVVGLPGETITIRDGYVYIDDELYIEEALYDRMEDGGVAVNGVTLGEDEYFVLGDNRNNSEDSRHGNIGIVKKDYILGKAWFHGKSEEGAAGLIK